MNSFLVLLPKQYVAGAKWTTSTDRATENKKERKGKGKGKEKEKEIKEGEEWRSTTEVTHRLIYIQSSPRKQPKPHKAHLSEQKTKRRELPSNSQLKFVVLSLDETDIVNN